jgi:hypothetical protein
MEGIAESEEAKLTAARLSASRKANVCRVWSTRPGLIWRSAVGRWRLV